MIIIINKLMPDRCRQGLGRQGKPVTLAAQEIETTMQDDASRKHGFQDLPWAEKFLVWALRQWVETSRSKGEFHVMLREAFRLARVADGYLAFDALMTVVSVSTTKSITLGAPRCSGVTPDERTFLGMIASLQRSDRIEGCRLLGLWLAPAGVRLAQPPAARLARLMLRGGLRLRRPAIIRAEGDEAATQEQTPTASRPIPPAVL